ncbi:hypothetical protein DFP72DRAFT_504962 [Ephemerocybe angulata]|uniref:Uncharacterized protein n=1 Tax=Ephemerocybe angulata TaxID=980116 RepID=A0A8H6HPJ1_9AGAR|nr:hypothetical protein DFP72DRAFT_504962 [Tulosesus angulatus]
MLHSTDTTEQTHRNQQQPADMCDFKLAHPASVALDPGPSRILEHVGACILFDSTLDRLEEPCGLCLLPSKLCRYVVVKGKGSQASLHVDWELGVHEASISRTSGPRSILIAHHAPISLSHVHCPKSERYNLRFHLERVLSVEVVTPYSKLWTLSGDEMEGMRHVWKQRRRAKSAVSTNDSEAIIENGVTHRIRRTLLGSPTAKNGWARRWRCR